MSQFKNHISVENIMVRHGSDILLHDTSWQIKPSQHWAVIGPNGSGKSTLIKSLWGGCDIARGSITLKFNDKQTKHPPKFKGMIGYVAFELQQDLFNEEDFLDQMREYCGREDEVTSARDIILSAVSDQDLNLEERFTNVIKSLGIPHLTSRSLHALSTGELRKALIARALMKDPHLLILDEPFDGLDEPSRKSLTNSIRKLINHSNVQLILIAHRLEEIVPEISHVLMMKDGSNFKQGPKEKILTSQNVSALYDCHLNVTKTENHYQWSYDIHQHKSLDSNTLKKALSYKENDGGSSVVPDSATPFIEFKDVTVAYGDTTALKNFTWEFCQGENWAILGPNGSGKSTIIKLITGDNLQGYSNNIKLFGHKRGSNQSLWDLKKNIGYVSGEVQLNYRKKIPTFDVICSGFYDSIGLYRFPTKQQEEIANAWIKILNISDLLDYNYNVLSYGQKRMVLLARAMVKAPKLLIVDEPCHGLDIKNRSRILDIIQRIGETPTNILYVTHHAEEILPAITNILHLKDGQKQQIQKAG